MFRYQPPLRDLQFVLHELLEGDRTLAALQRSTAWDRETIDQTLAAAGRFAERELAPLNGSGDAEGCHLDAGRVVTPKGFTAAYQQFVQDGWPALACAERYGGQGAPAIVYAAVLELLYAANPAWTMYFGTAHGAYDCLQAHATAAQKAYFLPKIVSGEWTTTMCLTEPHCGSDLGLLRTRAMPAADGSYRITGAKLFISGGDQDLTENIVHLVLARLPESPPGVGGVSLFVVPKHLPAGDGLCSARNGMTATAVEHKMGLRGSATCAMNFENSVGWLVGQSNQGLRNMFVMINTSRIGVAVQAVGMGQAAYRSALEYARERLQMRAAGGAKRSDLPADPIIEHADVRRMLLTQKAHVEAARMLVCWLAILTDQEAMAADAVTRRQAATLVGLLTPVAKAFLTENAFLVASLAIQIHGGHGYIRDHGVEQIVRDIRIAQIYEGTNGIQARDLLTRKVFADGAAGLGAFLDRVRADAGCADTDEAPGKRSAQLRELCDEIMRLAVHLREAARTQPDEVGAAGWDFLRALGHVTCGWLFARAITVARQRAIGAPSDPFYAAKIATARFYFARLLPEARMHLDAARAGLASLSDLHHEQLFV